jgi:hypothetical protein
MNSSLCPKSKIFKIGPHKLNGLYPYLPILLPIGHIIIYLQLSPLVTHLGVTFELFINMEC